MKQHTPKIIPVRHFLIGCGVLLLFIVGTLFYFYQKEAGEEKRLRGNGVETDAWVLEMKEYRTKKKRGGGSSNYYMDVAWFADTAARSTGFNDTAVSEAKNGADLVDKLFNKMQTGQRPLGDYQTLSIPISGLQYKKYNRDDKVRIVYLKDDPTIVRLMEDM